MSAEEPLKSRERPSSKENDRIWAEEAERRDRGWDANPTIGVPASDVFRDIRARHAQRVFESGHR
jgi:hypothetical protein